MTLATPPFQKFLRVMCGLSQGTCLPNLKSVALTVLEKLALIFQKFRGHVTVATPPFRKNFSGVMSRLFLGTCLPNLKSVALNVLALDSDHQLKHKIDGPKFADPRLTAVSP